MDVDAGPRRPGSWPGLDGPVPGTLADADTLGDPHPCPAATGITTLAVNVGKELGHGGSMLAVPRLEDLGHGINLSGHRGRIKVLIEVGRHRVS